MWDEHAAIKHLNSKKRKASTHHCAEFTREAIEAGGTVLKRHRSAKDYGLSLRDAGFIPLLFDPGIYAQGDVVVIEGFEGHADGHMAMFNGNTWVSDFEQRDIYPGPAYKKRRPNYTIWRHCMLWVKSLTLPIKHLESPRSH